jgi:hypothetical protein
LTRLVSRDQDGEPPWLGPEAELSVEHLSMDGHDPLVTARLLASLGFRVPDDAAGAGRLRRSVWPPDKADLPTLVLRENLDPNGAELHRDRPVPMAHLTIATTAFPGQAERIADALRAAGYRLSSGNPPNVVDPVGVDLLSTSGNGRPPWRRADHVMPPYHLFRVAERHNIRIEDVVAKLSALDIPVPQLPAQEDEHLLARLVRDVHTYGYFDAETPVRPSVIVRLAQADRVPDREVARRLASLGYSVHALDDDPRRPDDYGDLMLLSRDYDGQEPWLDTECQVPWHHVLRAAQERRQPTGEIVACLARYGYRTAPEPPAGNWKPGEEQQTLLCTLDNILWFLMGPSQKGWLTATRPVPLTHVFHTAHLLARTPAEVAHRLRQLGHVLPDDVEFTDPATP